MGAQIPVIPENPLPVCGCRKFGIDTLGDHLCTCTAHSGVKKGHDWISDEYDRSSVVGPGPPHRFGSSSDPNLNGKLH
jgi:hypothetical protein